MTFVGQGKDLETPSGLVASVVIRVLHSWRGAVKNWNQFAPTVVRGPYSCFFTICASSPFVCGCAVIARRTTACDLRSQNVFCQVLSGFKSSSLWSDGGVVCVWRAFRLSGTRLQLCMGHKKHNLFACLIHLPPASLTKVKPARQRQTPASQVWA